MDQDLQIPPAKSPLLLPSRARELQANSRTPRPTEQEPEPEDDNLDDLEFLAPGNWEEREDRFPGDGGEGGFDDEEGDDGDSDDSLEDFSLEDGRIAGVPSSTMKLDAK